MREHAGIADDQVIMKSIAPGWPDETFPASVVVEKSVSLRKDRDLIYDRTAAIMFSSIGAPRGSSATPTEVRA